MNYIKLSIVISDEYHEPFIAELMDMEFEGFQQLDNELVTYIAKKRYHIGDRERIERLLAGFPGEGYLKAEEVVASQNWNEAWEKTIEAQEIGPFLVKPTWSTNMPRENQILLEIDPKMAFGTGYHETTRLMLQRLPHLINSNDTVLDAGTGTGILAIAAVKLGAKYAVAFDIDEWSITNARENIYLNKVAENIEIHQGTQQVITDKQHFDVICANIHQNVIMEMIPFFSNHLSVQGRLLLSGLLEKDEDDILKSLNHNGIEYVNTFQLNEWIAIEARA